MGPKRAQMGPKRAEGTFLKNPGRLRRVEGERKEDPPPIGGPAVAFRTQLAPRKGGSIMSTMPRQRRISAAAIDRDVGGDHGRFRHHVPKIVPKTRSGRRKRQ